MQIYHYDRNTFELLGTSEAEQSPLNPAQPLIPAFATAIAPPDVIPTGKAAVFSQGTNTWSLVDDLRGTDYWMPDRSQHTMDELGPLPEGALTEEPPLDVVDYAAVAVQQLNIACQAHIVGGFVSNALGADHTYPCHEHDQRNLNGVVTESLLNDADANWEAPFWCADANDVWDRRVHGHDQIRSVGVDAAAHVRAAQDKLKQLTDQINAIVAGSGTDDEKRAAIDAVIW